MPTGYIGYRYRCVNEGVDVYEQRPEDDPQPTTCVNDVGHTIVLESVTVVSQSTTERSYTTDPSTSDDFSAGFKVGDTWLNRLTNNEFVCLNSDVGSAVWIKTTITDHADLNGIGTNTHAQIDAHLADASGNPHGVTKAQVGLSEVENIKNKYDGTAPPVASDDTTEGFAIGSLWIDTAENKAYICSDATENAAVWGEITVVDSGEVNTMANVGGSGHGWFKQKSGVEFQLRKAAPAASNRVSIATNAGNNTLDFDVVEGNLVHDHLSGAGTNTHAQIDAHIADATKHRVINDAGTGAADLWSASKIGTALEGKIPYSEDTLMHLQNASVNAANHVQLKLTKSGTTDNYNMNIDTSAPVHLLFSSEFGTYRQAQITGGASALGKVIWGLSTSNDSGATWNPRICATQGGNLGLGKNNPSEKLDIMGNIALTGTVDGRDVAADGAALDSHVSNTTGNPHAVTKAQVGLGNVEDVKNKRDATTFPSTGNDATQGYSVGSVWVDVSNDKAYICSDSSTGAAVWNEITSLGEITTMGNIGGSGVGVFKQKTGSAFELKKLRAGSSKVSISDNTGGNTVDIDLNAGNINHASLSGAGANTHAQIDAHLADTSGNPHGVTKAQVGLGNVENIKSNFSGVEEPDGDNDATEGYEAGSQWLDTTANIGYVCVDATAGSAIWKQTTGGGQVEYFDMYTTTEAQLSVTGAWVDMPLDVERQAIASLFSHAGSSAEVTINATDRYLVIYRVMLDVVSGTDRTQSTNKLQINAAGGGGYADVAGSFSQNYHREVTEGQTTATVALVHDFEFGDKIKVQSKRLSGGNTLKFKSGACGLTIMRIKGKKGDKGETGSGSNVTVRDQGFSVANTPHDILNFNDPVFTLADEGGGVVSIQINEAAIAHQNLSGAGTNTHAQIDAHISDSSLHRTINDAGTSATELWSASKISTALAGKSATGHTHTKASITDFAENSYVHTTGAETVQGRKTFSSDRTVIGDGSMSTSYTCSLQRNQSHTYLEILNDRGSDRGVFFGAGLDNFELWNWMAGHIDFYVAPAVASGAVKFRMQNDGVLRIYDLGAGVVRSNALGQLSYQAEGTAFNKSFGTTAGTVTEGSHASDTANPHAVTKAQVGLGNVVDTKVKLDATAAPAATDDSGSGYSAGSLWVDAANDNVYVCVDSTASSAVWRNVSVVAHGDLSDVGSNTHAQIDSHISDASLHRTINDAGSGAADLWSASKISSELGGKAASSHTHATSDITSGTFANALIAQSNVTQHEGAITHQNLSGAGTNTHAQIDAHIADGGKHREINDSLSGTANLWSASKISSELASKAAASHTHSASNITSGTFANARIAASNVTQHVSSLVHQSLSGAGTNTHAQIDTHISDAAKHRIINDSGTGATELWSASKINTMLGGKASASHTHSASDITSGTLDDGRISSSSVTQHLGGYIPYSEGNLISLSNGSPGSENHVRFLITKSWSEGDPYNMGLDSDAVKIVFSAEDGVYRQACVQCADVSSPEGVVFALSGSSDSGSTWAARFVVQHNGFMAVGHNSPSEMLDVDGNIKVTGTVDGRSVAADGAALDAHVGDAAKHRIINDAGTSSTELWSASKINAALGGKAATTHTHAASDIVSGTFANARIAASSVTQHVSSLVHDSLSGAGSNTHAQIDAHLASTSNPHGVDKGDVGLGNVPNLKVNLSATSEPTTSEDASAGYAVGSRWIDTTADKEYVCLDASSGSAVWTETTASGAGSSPWTENGSDIYRGSGDVGIGISSSSEARLHVRSTGTGSGNPWVRFDGGSGPDAGSCMYLFYDTGTSFAPIHILSDYDDPPRSQWQQTGSGSEDSPQYWGWLGMSGNSSNNMSLMTNGNFGVGTQSPSAKLHVAGTLSVDSNFICSGNLTCSGNIVCSGNVDGRNVSADGSTLDAHVGSTSNPHGVDKGDVGLGNVPNLKVNLSATSAPTSGDDSGDGYSIGSRWVDVASDEEYVCVDAASGAAVWKSTTSGGGSSGGGSSQQEMYIVSDVKSQGSDGGSAYNDAWRTRTLNTLESHNGTSVAIANNRFTLQPGQYTVRASSPYYKVNEVVTRLRNITDSSTAAIGTTAYSNDKATVHSWIHAYIDISSATTYELQYYCDSDESNYGLGVGANVSGHSETFTQIVITSVPTSGDSGSSGGGGTAAAYFDKYTTTETSWDVTNTWIDLPLDAEHVATSSIFSHSAPDPHVTIGETDRYIVTYRIAPDITSGSARSQTENRLVRDAGSGYALVPGTLSGNYHRLSSAGQTTATVTCVLDLDAGDKIKVQCQRTSGSDDLKFLSGASGLTIVRLPSGGGSGGGATSLEDTGYEHHILRDEKSQGTDGGTFTSGDWRTRDLNVIDGPSSGNVSLSSNQFTLQPGTYNVKVAAPCKGVHRNKARLYNVTDGSVAQYGQTAKAASYNLDNVECSTLSTVDARVEITTAKTYRVEHRCEDTEFSDGFGEATGWGTEVYTVVTVTKIA